VDTIVTEVKIGNAVIPGEIPIPFIERFQAIWDTGATKSTIKQSVALRLKLPEIRPATTLGIGGRYETFVYLASLILPNNIFISEIELLGCDNSLSCDMLIGMDIISLGDFLVSNGGSATTFSFTIPPYAGGIQLQTLLSYIGRDGLIYQTPLADEIAGQTGRRTPYVGQPAVGRNASCPCGSGKKYKKCCGTGT
jgi:hypothetical protein